MDTPEQAVEKLKEIIEKTNWSQPEVARRLDISQSNVSRYLKMNPDYQPGVRTIIKIDEVYREVMDNPNIEAAEGPTRALRIKARGDVENLNIVSGAGGGGLLAAEYGEDGHLVDPALSDGWWTFPDTVKRGMRNLRQIKAIPVIGDSMEPTIAKGATVFVDTTHVYPNPEDIYALDYGDGLVIKRLALVPRSDKILVISDNRERYGEPYELSREDVRVYGRVVAWFQWRG
jgi:transcriptional regulator with XRE-family HTH domain